MTGPSQQFLYGNTDNTARQSGRPTRPPDFQGSFLLRNLLEHPEDKVGLRLLNSEALELGGDLAAVVGRVIHYVPQQRPRRQCRGSATPAIGYGCCQSLRGQR